MESQLVEIHFIVFKSFGGRYKRSGTPPVSKRCKGKPNEEIYATKNAYLQELEKLSEQSLIDLFYGDESHVSSEEYIPYKCQFPDKKVVIYVERRYKINVCGLISRQSQYHWATTQ